MAGGGRAFVIANEVFHHRNDNILTLWELLNDEKLFFLFKFNYINTHLHPEENFNRLKVRYIDSCNFLYKRVLVIQPSTLVVTKDSDISNYLHLSIHSSTIILLYNKHSTWTSPTNELKFNY